MIRRLLGPVGGPILFFVVAALVFAGLGWVTVASLRVEQDQRETAAQAERAGKLRLSWQNPLGRPCRHEPVSRVLRVPTNEHVSLQSPTCHPRPTPADDMLSRCCKRRLGQRTVLHCRAAHGRY